MPSDHGGDIAAFIEDYGREPLLDFSANVSPLGVPTCVRDAVVAALDTADRYPDPLCRALSRRIAEHEGVDPSCVIVTNGCSDAIWRLAGTLSGRHVVVPMPTFSEYEAALSWNRCEIERIPISQRIHTTHIEQHVQQDCAASDSFLRSVRPGTGAVFVCQPNNPTGELVTKSNLLPLLQRCEDMGALLVVDECFIGFVDDPVASSVADMVATHPKLVVLKAFTKLWGMAGIRLGYALCADPRLLDGMRAAGAPWSVSSLAQSAGLAALDDTNYERRARELVQSERRWMTDRLASLGIEARGTANFLFFELDDNGSLARNLREMGILIRDCSNYPGLSLGAYRVAIRTHAENERLLDAIATTTK